MSSLIKNYTCEAGLQYLHNDEHVDKLCSKVNRSISGLKQARDYVPLDVLNSIYKSLIQPVFDYCDIVWDNLDQGLATRIQKLQNRAARIITFQG